MIEIIPTYKVTWKTPGYTHTLILCGHQDVETFLKTLFFNGINSISIEPHAGHPLAERTTQTTEATP